MRQRQIAEFIAAVEALPEKVSEFQNDLWAMLVDHVAVYGKEDVLFPLTNGVGIAVKKRSKALNPAVCRISLVDRELCNNRHLFPAKSLEGVALIMDKKH